MAILDLADESTRRFLGYIESARLISDYDIETNPYFGHVEFVVQHRGNQDTWYHIIDQPTLGM